MKKIPTIFKRNPENPRELLNEPHPDCLWVFNGEGVARRKYDGTCAMIDCGKYYRRHTIQKNQNQTGRPDFIEVDYDPVTGKRYGWREIDKYDPDSRWHMEALNNMPISAMRDGTYEVIGENIRNNAENIKGHLLVPHRGTESYMIDTDFNNLSKWLFNVDIEGLVFHHPDGRMGKIKKRDLGLAR